MKIFLIVLISLVMASVSWWFISNQKMTEKQFKDLTGLSGEVFTAGAFNIVDTSSPHSSPGTIPISTPLIDSCLTNPGPLITLSGNNAAYKNKELADNTKIDASMATFENGGEHPVTIGGGTDICWYSGKIFGGYPLDASWETTHPTAGIQIQDGTYRPVVEELYIDQIGDGIKVRIGEYSGQTGITQPFTVRGVWLRDIRDDCIESDWQAGAIIEDSLLDGCYVLFATEKRPSASTDGSDNTWEIRDTLAFMHDQIGVYDGESPGHGKFFKWDETSPKWEMYNSILRVDSDVSESSNQFNFQLEKLVDCENNILVWLGSGPFPGLLPTCFSITTDKSIWDNAVWDWKIRHGFISPVYNYRIFTPLLFNGGID
jgi:hypothetical protein